MQDLIKNLKLFVDIDSVINSEISKNKDHIKFFMSKGLS